MKKHCQKFIKETHAFGLTNLAKEHGSHFAHLNHSDNFIVVVVVVISFFYHLLRKKEAFFIA